MEKHKKRILIDHPYIGSIVMTMVLFLGISRVGRSLGAELNAALGLDPQQSLLISVIAVTLLILLVYRLWLRKEHFSGVLSVTGGGMKEACVIAAIVFAIDVICILAITALEYGGIDQLVMPGVATFLIALCAGIYEETAFRAIPVSILMKNRPTDRRIILAVIITSVIFGGVHMMNISAGVKVSIAAYQSVQAMIIGAMFTAFYLRTGSIVLPMVFHFLHDIAATMIPAQSTGAMLQQTIATSTLIIDIIIMISEIAATIYLLRPGKMEEIRETWKNKWSEHETDQLV